MERNTGLDIYKHRVQEYLSLVRVMRGDISWKDLADMTGQSVQNLHQKVKRGSLSSAELLHIADVLDCDVKFIDKKTGKVII